MQYVTPDLEGNALAYTGRRFWVIDLQERGIFQGFSAAVAAYVIFDRFGDLLISRV